MQSGKTAVVTGGTRGIGRAIALELAKQGVDIALVYAGNEEAAAQARGDIEALGRRAATYRCDVASFTGTQETVAQILQDFEAVDILVNNAGITRDTLVLSMKEEQFDRVLDTNLKGAFHMIRHLTAPMIRRRAGGRIVNITSVVGLMGNAGQSNYAASKAGLIGLTKSVARELAGREITCNAVAPGFIDTEMTGQMPEKAVEMALSRIPMGHMGTVEDVAALVAFLCSGVARYITGEVIRVDGGMAM